MFSEITSGGQGEVDYNLGYSQWIWLVKTNSSMKDWVGKGNS